MELQGVIKMKTLKVELEDNMNGVIIKSSLKVREMELLSDEERSIVIQEMNEMVYGR